MWWDRSRTRTNAVASGAAESDCVFAGEVGTHAGDVQDERTARDRRERAGVLINREAMHRQERSTPSRVDKFSSAVHGQNMSKIQIESGEW